MALTFIFSNLCFLEACLYGKYRNKKEADLRGFSFQTSKEVDFWVLIVWGGICKMNTALGN